MAQINRVFWIILFLSGCLYFAMLEWSEETNQSLGWFLLTSLWSAFCGIGFTIFDWLFRFKNK